MWDGTAQQCRLDGLVTVRPKQHCPARSDLSNSVWTGQQSLHRSKTIVAYAIPRDDKHNEDVLLHLKYTTCLSGSCHHGIYAGD